MSFTDESLRSDELSAKLRELHQEFEDLKRVLEHDDTRYNQRDVEAERRLDGVEVRLDILSAATARIENRCDKLDECQTIYDRMIERTNERLADLKSTVHQICDDLVANQPDADVAEAEIMECDNVAAHFSRFVEDRGMFYTYLREVDKKVQALRPDASSDDDEVDRDEHLDFSYERFQTKVRAVYESALRLDTFVKSMKRPRPPAESDSSSESVAKKAAQ